MNEKLRKSRVRPAWLEMSAPLLLLVGMNCFVAFMLYTLIRIPREERRGLVEDNIGQFFPIFLLIICLCVGFALIIDAQFEQRRLEAGRETYLRKSEVFHRELQEYLELHRETSALPPRSDMTDEDEERWLTDLLDEMEERHLAASIKVA